MAVAIYCTQCGLPRADRDRFCGGCGEPFGESTPARLMALSRERLGHTLAPPAAPLDTRAAMPLPAPIGGLPSVVNTAPGAPIAHHPASIRRPWWPWLLLLGSAVLILLAGAQARQAWPVLWSAEVSVEARVADGLGWLGDALIGRRDLAAGLDPRNDPTYARARNQFISALVGIAGSLALLTAGLLLTATAKRPQPRPGEQSRLDRGAPAAGLALVVTFAAWGLPTLLLAQPSLFDFNRPSLVEEVTAAQPQGRVSTGSATGTVAPVLPVLPPLSSQGESATTPRGATNIGAAASVADGASAASSSAASSATRATPRTVATAPVSIAVAPPAPTPAPRQVFYRGAPYGPVKVEPRSSHLVQLGWMDAGTQVRAVLTVGFNVRLSAVSGTPDIGVRLVGACEDLGAWPHATSGAAISFQTTRPGECGILLDNTHSRLNAKQAALQFLSP